MTSPLSRLAEIEAEAQRALQGLKEGSILNGVTALQNCKLIASDALADAHSEGRILYDEDSVRVP